MSAVDRCLGHGEAGRCPPFGPEWRLGVDRWGNCGRRVVPRREPEHAPGLVVADYGCNGHLVAYDESGMPTYYREGGTVGVGSPMHEFLLAMGEK